VAEGGIAKNTARVDSSRETPSLQIPTPFFERPAEVPVWQTLKDVRMRPMGAWCFGPGVGMGDVLIWLSVGGSRDLPSRRWSRGPSRPIEARPDGKRSPPRGTFSPTSPPKCRAICRLSARPMPLPPFLERRKAKTSEPALLAASPAFVFDFQDNLLSSSKISKCTAFPRGVASSAF